ncbi:MAG: beta-lactamase hydrolase domain-containing protein [Woeseiaceae bacterium]
MKKLIAVALSFLFLGCGSVADEKVIAVSVEDLQANPAILSDQNYISTGQPDAALFSAAKDAGYAAVIDLRTAGEDRGMDEADVLDSLGMSYHLIEVAGAGGVNFENAQALDDALAGIDGPVLLHCRTGNRVGALLALRASMNGASDEEALAIGKASGLTSLEGAVVEQLAQD